jgi:hypothetical protein
MKRTKIAFGVLALGLGALGSGFTAKPLITAGWYGASDGDVAKSSSTTLPVYNRNDFPTRIGDTEPGVGFGQACASMANYVCAAYFTTGGSNANDPSGNHDYFVTGEYQN